MGRKTWISIRLVFKGIVKLLCFAWILQIVLIGLLRWIPVYITPLIIIRGVEKVMANEPIGYYKTWKSWSNISPYLKAGVLCAEDQNFLNHNGFDTGAIKKAIEYNKRQETLGSNKRRGASTISQQTAKNVFLWPGRSWLRKGLEVYFTFCIETLWGKKRILEVYLNIAEMGPRIYGAEAAAQQYFKKSSANLTPGEAALLASVLPSPLRYSVVNPGPYMRQRQQWVLQQTRFNATIMTFAKQD